MIIRAEIAGQEVWIPQHALDALDALGLTVEEFKVVVERILRRQDCTEEMRRTYRPPNEEYEEPDLDPSEELDFD